MWESCNVCLVGRDLDMWWQCGNLTQHVKWVIPIIEWSKSFWVMSCNFETLREALMPHLFAVTEERALYHRSLQTDVGELYLMDGA